VRGLVIKIGWNIPTYVEKKRVREVKPIKKEWASE
jgi:hypothetical protein